MDPCLNEKILRSKFVLGLFANFVLFVNKDFNTFPDFFTLANLKNFLRVNNHNENGQHEN